MERVHNRRNQFLCHWVKNSSRFIYLVREFDLRQEFAAREFDHLIHRDQTFQYHFESREVRINTRQMVQLARSLGIRKMSHAKHRNGGQTGLPEWRGGKTYQRTATMIRTRAAMPTMTISRSLSLSLPAAKS